MSRKQTVFVGMSGGVDSSVAAHLLKEQGSNVVGVFIRCYNVDGCAERDAEDARRVAERLGIPFYVLDLEREYKERVVQYMVEGYRAGLTPNPDVMCNREIKFGLFMEYARSMGADYVATGHYVRKAESRILNLESRKKRPDSRFQILNTLHIAADPNKDQSYFLWTLTQDQLRHSLFPLGAYKKTEVRKIARRLGLQTAEKKDSQGICFLGQVTLADFLSAYIPGKKGAILTPEGEVVGEHHGAQFLTIGQRHVGANIQYPAANNQKKGARQPVYVVGKDVGANTVTVAEGRDNPLLFKKEIDLVQVNLIHPLRTTYYELRTSLPVLARVRYRQPLASAMLRLGKKGTAELIFDHPQEFVAEGQSAVFYTKKGEMLGGGVIGGSRI